MRMLLRIKKDNRYYKYVIGCSIIGIVLLFFNVYNIYFWLIFLLVLLFNSNKEEIGVFMLLFGTSLFGRIFADSIVIYSITICCILLGVVLLRKEIHIIIINNYKSFFAFTFIWLFFLINFLLGYIDDYTTTKMFKLSIRGYIWLISFLILIQSLKISYTKLSSYFIVLVLFYLSQSAQFYGVEPSSFIDFAYFRRIGDTLEATPWGASVCNVHTLGYLGIASLVFRLMDGQSVSKNETNNTVFIFLFSIVISIISGARQTYVIAIIISLVWISFNNKISFKYKLLSILGLSFILILFTIISDSEYINRIFDTSISVQSRLHRDISTPLQSIKDCGLWGFGYGGYYYYSGRSYPHNFFIELISENGYIGSIILLVLIFFIIKVFGFTNIIYYKTVQGASMMYFILMFFLTANISGDMSSNIILFVLLFTSVKPYPLSFLKIKGDSLISIKVKNIYAH